MWGVTKQNKINDRNKYAIVFGLGFDYEALSLNRGIFLFFGLELSIHPEFQPPMCPRTVLNVFFLLIFFLPHPIPIVSTFCGHKSEQ